MHVGTDCILVVSVASWAQQCPAIIVKLQQQFRKQVCWYLFVSVYASMTPRHIQRAIHVFQQGHDVVVFATHRPAEFSSISTLIRGEN